MNRTIIHAALAAGIMLLAASAAKAADISQFVVTGPAAKALLEDHMISVETAEKIGKACVALAKQQGVTLTVVILDQFGHTVYYYRMDGQTYNNAHTAEMKAHSALLRRAPTHVLANRVKDNTDALVRQYYLGFFTNAGGLPIIVNDVMIGVIGVGGSRPSKTWSDEICAHKALEQVVGPQPPLTPDTPARN